jgi:catechol 2,3-dioxygenase-like lactoylglutathione lyase family enzyme
MGFHHIAIATRDLEATHRFYTEACGFELVKVVAAPTPEGAGWARHVFYDTGNGELFAVWDLHSPSIPAEFPTAISTALGLPNWVNHIAFHAPDLDTLHAARDRWIAHGHDVAEIDHGWCTSVYADDPNGVMVEFCATTAAFTAADRDEAARLLAADQPELDLTPPPLEFFTGAKEHEPA